MFKETNSTPPDLKERANDTMANMLPHKPKKSSIFTREEAYQFLFHAPEHQYLMWKVGLIFGVARTCRMDELKKITIDDVQDKTMIIPESKTEKTRTFTVTDKVGDNLNPIELYGKYRSLRPSHTLHRSLFVFYRFGKSSTQPIGMRTFRENLSLIAIYLKLPNSNTYTGHPFRRTSASLLSDTGSDSLTLKQHGGWKSSPVAEDYVESSVARKPKIASKILKGQSEYEP